MKNAVLLFFIACCISCSVKKPVVVDAPKTAIAVADVAKGNSNPMAIWTFTKNETSEPNQYMITAQLKLAKNWHIFDFEPGGDGLLIAPEFSFKGKDVQILKKEAVGTIITTKFAGVDGDVRYYENEVSFKVLVRSNDKDIKGSVYYQICDHEKCLAPTEEPLLFTN